MSLSPGSPAYWYTDSHVAMSSCSDDDTSSSTFEMAYVPRAPASPTTATTSKASSPAAIPIGASLKQKAPLKPKSKVAAGPTPPTYPPPKGHAAASAAGQHHKHDKEEAHIDKQHRSKRDKDEAHSDKQHKRHRHHDRELRPEVREEARQQHKREKHHKKEKKHDKQRKKESADERKSAKQHRADKRERGRSRRSRSRSVRDRRGVEGSRPRSRHTNRATASAAAEPRRARSRRKERVACNSTATSAAAARSEDEYSYDEPRRPKLQHKVVEERRREAQQYADEADDYARACQQEAEAQRERDYHKEQADACVQEYWQEHGRAAAAADYQPDAHGAASTGDQQGYNEWHARDGGKRPRAPRKKRGGWMIKCTTLCDLINTQKWSEAIALAEVLGRKIDDTAEEYQQDNDSEMEQCRADDEAANNAN